MPLIWTQAMLRVTGTAVRRAGGGGVVTDLTVPRLRRHLKFKSYKITTS